MDSKKSHDVSDKKIKEEIKKEKQGEKALEKEEKEAKDTVEADEDDIEKLEEKDKKLEKEEKEIEKEEKRAENGKKTAQAEIKLRAVKDNIKECAKKISFSSISSFFSKNRWVIILLLLIIPLFLSTYYRSYPAYLPATDDWARDTVYNNLKGSISSQITQQYPNLPDASKQKLIDQNFEEFLNQRGEDVEKQIQQTSEYFTSKMQDEDGQTYLLAIDPWLWYGNAKNYEKYGHYGNEIINGESWYSLRNGRIGQRVGFTPMAFFAVQLHRIMNIFGDYSMMAASFYLPVVIMAIAVAAAFFIGLKIAGYPGAVASSVVVGVHAALLSRTSAGFSDTDNLITFYEMLVALFFVLAFDEKNIKRSMIWLAVSGIFLGLYSSAGHSSWWHIAYFLMAASFIYFVYHAWQNRKTLKKSISKFAKIPETGRISGLVLGLPVLGVISGGIFASFLSNQNMVEGVWSRALSLITSPLNFIALKDVAITTVWPNVMTTVAELNTGALEATISQMGGNFLMMVSLIGALYLFFVKKDDERAGVFYGSLVAVWFIASMYAAQSSIRFVAFVVPAFALGIGGFAKLFSKVFPDWLAKEISMKKHALRTVFIILILVFVFAPIMKAADSTARNEIPSMNDAWYESIKGIKENSTDAIITSWWDFGHWFVAVAERRVTFDGGNQGKRIHWVGKSLLTSDENEAVGILRMLNCGQEEAGNALVKYMKNDTVKAVEVLKRILLMERAEAEKELADNGLSQKAVGEVIELTHCEDLIDQYYITSEDMIGKAGVWGHFGSWNFTKASMYNKVIRKNQENGVRILINDFGIDEEEAENLFFEIKNADPDRWISPWPGYMGTGSCSVNNNVVDCDKGAVIIDLDDMTVLLRSGQNLGVPHSLVYADEEGVKEKVFNNSNIEVSVALIPDGNSYKSILMDPLQATGMFTKLFFFKGHGLECFDLLSYKKSFRNNEIYVWKLDWNCEGKNVVYEDEKSANIDVPENGNATDTTMNNTDNESEQ